MSRWPALFHTEAEAWGEAGTRYPDLGSGAFTARYYPVPTGKPEPVTIRADYGNDIEWTGTATPTRVIGPLSPWGDES